MTPPRLFRIAGTVLIALVAAWAGSRVYSALSVRSAHRSAMRTPAGESSPPTATDLAAEDLNTPLPPAAKIPDRLPVFSLQGRDGKATSIERWQGESLIINFWATWCAPCRREIPLLERLNDEWGPRGVRVIGIAVDHRDRVLAYADKLKIGYPVLIGEQDALDVATRLGVESPVFPFTVFTDSRGEVVALYIGELHAPQANLILSVVQNLNQNQVALPQARRTIAEGLHTIGEISRDSSALSFTFADKGSHFRSISGYYPGPLH